MTVGRSASVLRRVLQPGGWLLAVWLFVLHVTHAAADAPAEPSAEQCIAFHVEGQAERMAGHFTAAAELFKACLQPACSPVLRADCATQLASVEEATPSLVLAATADGTDLMDVTVTEQGKQIASRLDGRPVPLDPGPHELLFEAQGMAPLTHPLVVRAGEKNRLVSVQLSRLASTSAPSVRPMSPTTQGATLLAKADSVARVTRGDYLLLGTSLSLAGAGLGLALWAQADTRSAKDECSPLCSDSRVRSIRLKAGLADGLFVLSAATLVAFTLRVALREPRASRRLRTLSEERTALLLGPTSVTGRLSF